jgi:hypothetical protein
LPAFLQCGETLKHTSEEQYHTILVLNQTIEEHTSHTNGAPREEGVVVHTLTDLNTGRGVNVTCKQREDIVLNSFEHKIHVKIL